MSDIKNIISYINTVLQANSFAGKPFQKGRFYGIADLVKKTNNNEDNIYTVPIVLDADGNDGTEVVINDIYPFQLYHRIKARGVEDAEIEDQFGDGNDKIINFTMALVVFSDKSITEIDADEYITALMLDIPRTIKATLISNSQFSKCELEIGGAETNATQVFSDEYGRNDFETKQSYVAISLEYTIKLTYQGGCFTLC